MTLTTAQMVRLRIQDLPQWADVTRYGDGTGTVVQLDHRNLSTASAYVPLGGTAWTATGCTFDLPSGVVTFSGVISANSAYRARYVWSTFSDDEIGLFTAVGGSVAGAALEAVNVLLFDGLKRAKWAAPDGTTYDDTLAMQHLLAMRSALREDMAEGGVSDGSFQSWSLGQEDW